MGEEGEGREAGAHSRKGTGDAGQARRKGEHGAQGEDEACTGDTWTEQAGRETGGVVPESARKAGDSLTAHNRWRIRSPRHCSWADVDWAEQLRGWRGEARNVRSMASLTGQRIAFGQGRHRIATSLGELTVHGLYRRMLRLGRQAVGGPQRRMPQYGVVRDRVKAGFVAAATAPPTEQQVEATLHFLELAARSPGPARRIVENLCHVAHYRTYEYA